MPVTFASLRRTASLLHFCALFAAVFAPTARAAAHSPSGGPTWLEPRGLGIFDLVGQVPEEHLQGAIIVNLPGNGLLIYESGSRSGGEVEINASVVPSYFTSGSSVFTRVGCLGQVATYDSWPVASPASRMEVFADGAPVHQTTQQVFYYPAGHIQPAHGAGSFERYDRIQIEPTFADDGSLELPANMGCSIIVAGQQTDVTARFRLTLPQRVQVEPLGEQQSIAQSYIGVGSAGILASLLEQMRGRFGDRATSVDLDAPAGADYVFVNYPPTPVDPYVAEPVEPAQPGGGTYRFEKPGGGLSVDRLNSAGVPLHGQWQDADQAGGEYLPHFGDPPRLAAPEYILPPGFAYDPCMTDGGCPDALLDEIHDASFALTIYYYRVSRVTDDGLTRIPLRQVGPDWTAGAAGARRPTATTAPAQEFTGYLPLVTMQQPAPEPPPEDPTGCPCGWFDADGAMVDFIPPQE